MKKLQLPSLSFIFLFSLLAISSCDNSDETFALEYLVEEQKEIEDHIESSE